MVRLRWNVWVAVACTFVCAGAFGQAVTWTGGGASGDAGDTGNWSSGVAPFAPATVYNATFGTWTNFGNVTISESEVTMAGLSAVTLNDVAFTNSTQAYSFSGTSGTPMLEIDGTLSTVANTNPIVFNSSLDLVLGGSSGPFTLASGSQVQVFSPVSGAGGISLAGSGTLTLGGAANYSGFTIVSGASTLQVVSGGSIGSNMSGIRVGYNPGDSATLAISSGGTVTDFYTAYVGGSSTGVGTVTVDGSGSAFGNFGELDLGVSGTGSLSVTNGGIVNSSVTVLGDSASGNGTITVSGAGSNLNLSNFLYVGSMGTGTVTLSNGGTLSTESSIYLGYYGSGSGTLNIGASSGSGAQPAGALDATLIQTISGAGTVQFNTTATSMSPYQLASEIYGATQVINTAGFNILSGNNGYTGSTLINGGTLAAGSSSAISSQSAVILSGSGTLALNGYDLTVGPLSSGSASSAVSVGSNTLTTVVSGPTTFAGVISGSGGGLTKAGSGTLTLTNAETYSGPTSINGGSLQLGNGTINGSIDSTSGLIDSGTLILDEGPGVVLSYPISGSGGVTSNSPNIDTLSGTNTYSGPTTVAPGGMLLAGSPSAFGGAAGLSAVTLLGNSTLSLNGYDNTVGSISSASSSSSISLGSKTLTTGGNNASTTFAGVISGSGGSLAEAGFGTLTLTGANVYSGPTTIGSGSNLELGNGATNGTLSGASAITDNGALILYEATGITLSNVVSGPGGITQAGSATNTLSGANTYSGQTFVNGGTLQAGSATAFGNGSAVILNASGVMSLNNFDVTVGSISSSSPSSGISLGANTLTNGGDNSSTTFAGVISGAGGSLTKAGAGTLALTGANTYSGATTINSGALQLGDGTTNGTLASTSGISVSGTLVADEATPVTISQAITGTGGNLTAEGPGTLILTAADTFSGATTITSGGSLQLGNGTTNGTISSTSGIYDVGTLTLDENTSVTFGQQITGDGSLVINGPADIEGDNLYLGGTTINSGSTVTIGTDTGLGSGPVTASYSTLNFTSCSPNLCSPSFTGGTVSFSGDPVLSEMTLFDSTLNFNGSSAEIRDMVSDGSESTSLINLATDTDLTIHVSCGDETDYHGTIADSDGTGSLTVTGSGVLNLRSESTYGGGTTINGGVLVVSSDGALGSGMVTINGCNAALGLDQGVTMTNPVCLETGAVTGYGTFASSSSFNIQNGLVIAGGRGTYSAASGQSDLPVQGLLTFSSCASLTFGEGGVYQFAVANAGGTTPGTDYSSINVQGSFSLEASPEEPFTIQLLSVNPGTGLLGCTSFDLGQSYSWTILTTPSCISGFSACDFTIDTSQFNGGSVSSSQFSVAAIGDNLVLNFTPVPEPSTWILMGGGLCVLAATAVRRRRRA